MVVGTGILEDGNSSQRLDAFAGKQNSRPCRRGKTVGKADDVYNRRLLQAQRENLRLDVDSTDYPEILKETRLYNKPPRGGIRKDESANHLSSDPRDTSLPVWTSLALVCVRASPQV